MNKRASGILSHITSLPSPYGIGDLGPNAYSFINFLSRAKQRYWQVLPVSPTSIKTGNSPYSSISTFAGNPLLISPDYLYKTGFLNKNDLTTFHHQDPCRVNFPLVKEFKNMLLETAFANFHKNKNWDRFEEFTKQHSFWLNNFVLYSAIRKQYNGKPWEYWTDDLKEHNPTAIKNLSGNLEKSILKEQFFQFLFFTQWEQLKKYANERGILIIGDIPYYVNYDSADVWEHQGLFKLGKDKKMTAVAGVPPDYFSKTGQRWGNPVYRWDILKKNDFSWWLARIKHQLQLFDIVRIDHFRGFSAYWEITAAEKTAVNGKWIDVPGQEFFDLLKTEIPALPIIAEDLGYITDDVRNLMKRYALPGMKVLQFAFGGDSDNPYLPHNHTAHTVVYTGTHDNNTTRGWFNTDISLKVKKHLVRYLGIDISREEVHWTLIRLAMMSIANTAIIPIQDILGLDEKARMNRPGVARGNWQWRFTYNELTPQVEKALLNLTKNYGRD